MKTSTLLKISVTILFTFTIHFSSMAQLGDFKPYPIQATANEKKDSNRNHFWGEVFGSLYTKVHADSVNSTSTLKTNATQYSQVPQGFNAFSVQRVYLGYDYFFNNKISAHVVLAHEELYDGNSKINTDNVSDRTFYLKYCFLEFDDIIKGITFNVGGIHTPSYSVLEQPFWGYRSLERTILDMRGIASANDVGVSASGKLWRKLDTAGNEDICVGFNLAVGNSTGAVPDNLSLTGNTPFKKYYEDIYVKLLHNKLIIDFYADEHTVQWSPYYEGNFTGRAFIGYKTKYFNISIESFEQLMEHQATITAGPDFVKPTTNLNRIQSGFSVEGAATLIKSKKTGDQKLGLVLRYDLYNPDANYNNKDTYAASYSTSNSYKENFILAALDYQPIKQIHVMPNIWYDGFENRALNANHLKLSDNDLVLRLTLYYQLYKL